MIVITPIASHEFIIKKWHKIQWFDGLVQGCGNSSANALELPQSCTKPSIYQVIHFPQDQDGCTMADDIVKSIVGHDNIRISDKYFSLAIDRQVLV